MFKFNELRQIHLEITNNCQASCPMCSRNYHGGIDNPLIKIKDWTLEHFKSIINEEVLTQIDSLYFCGNFGDPLLNNDLIEMIEFAVVIKPTIEIRVHTNGSIRGTEWWKRLAKAMPVNHLLIFGIDGLAETHKLYRIGTDFNKIIKNAKTFIEAGGLAEWAFIRFKHNAHEVEEAKTFAAGIGFQRFVMKDSGRFLLDSKFPVLNKNGDVTYYLEKADESKIVFIDRKVLKNYEQIVASSTISCQSQKNKEVYIDVYGRLFPCCWLAITPYNYHEEGLDMLEVRRVINKQFDNMIEDFGGMNNIDTNYHSIKSIVDSDAYQNVWKKYWTDPKMVTCARTCGVNTLSKPIDQFIERNIL